MPTYTQRPDGLAEVTLDDGRVLPTALDPATLEQQGIFPAGPSAGAANMSAPGMSREIAPPAPAAPPPAATPAAARAVAPDFFAPEPPPDPMAQQYEQMASRYDPPPGPPRGDPSRLASTAPVAPAAQQLAPAAPGGGPGSNEMVLDATKQYMQGLFAPPRAAPGKRIPAHDERAAYSIKYKDISEDPQLAEDISETRVDQQLGRQAEADQIQADRGTQARIAANEAQQLQRQVEDTVRRKSEIETEVGRRLKGIDDRLARARAVTESGSARERVMKGKGTFGRILAVIGQALATFAMPQTGGKNIVTEQIDKEVAEELEREKQLYDVSPDASSLKAYVDAWGTPQQALKEMELSKRMAVQAQMEAWVRRAGAEAVPIEFQNWLNDQALGILEQKQALQREAAGEVMEQWRRVPERVVGGGAGPLDPLKVVQKGAQFSDALRKIYNDPKQADAAMLRIRETQSGRSVRTPSGEKLYAPDGKRAQDAEMQLASIAHIHHNIEEIRRIMAKPYSEINLPDRERINVLVQSSVTLGKEAEKLGALSGPDMALIEPLAGALAKQRLNPLNPDNKIRAGLEQAAKHFTSRAVAAERGLYRDPDLMQPYRAGRPGSFSPPMVGRPAPVAAPAEAEE